MRSLLSRFGRRRLHSTLFQPGSFPLLPSSARFICNKMNYIPHPEIARAVMVQPVHAGALDTQPINTIAYPITFNDADCDDLVLRISQQTLAVSRSFATFIWPHFQKYQKDSHTLLPCIGVVQQSKHVESFDHPLLTLSSGITLGPERLPARCTVSSLFCIMVNVRTTRPSQ
jgi:hypothetical protein